MGMRLDVDADWYLYLWIDRGGDEDIESIPLGPIEAAEVPPGLAGDLAELLDRWRSADRIGDLRREWRDGYRRGL